MSAQVVHYSGTHPSFKDLIFMTCRNLEPSKNLAIRYNDTTMTSYLIGADIDVLVDNLRKAGKAADLHYEAFIQCLASNNK